MNTRQDRERKQRRVFATAFVVSVAIHGVVLGASTFRVPAKTGGIGEPDRPVQQSPYEVAAIELVELAEPPTPVTRDIFATDVEIVLAQPAQEPKPQPEPEAASRSSGEAARATPVPVPAEVAQAGIDARIALSMRPQFTAQRNVSSWALQPVESLDPHAGHDHAEDEGDDSGENSWWRRLGISIGRGGGRCPIPSRRPGVISR